MENQKVSIELSIAECNYVMQALFNMPYAQVVGLIETIRQQAQNQINASIPATEVVD